MSKWIDKLPDSARDYDRGSVALTRWNASSPTSSGMSRAARQCLRRNSAKQSSYFYLPNSIFQQTITGDWADNPHGDFTEPDMILMPDMSAPPPPHRGQRT
jgi:glutamine synthetase